MPQERRGEFIHGTDLTLDVYVDSGRAVGLPPVRHSSVRPHDGGSEAGSTIVVPPS